MACFAPTRTGRVQLSEAMAQIGYNNNVRYRDRAFHIQTEDSGPRTGNVITHLFVHGGRILHTMKASYADRATEAGVETIVKAMMKTQHKAMLVALREGKFDVELGEAARGPARPSQMPPASLEPIEQDLSTVHAPTDPPPATQPTAAQRDSATLAQARAPSLAITSEEPIEPPFDVAGPPTLRSDPPDVGFAPPRSRNTIVVHPPSNPEPNAQSNLDADLPPATQFDTLRPIPPSVSFSIPAAVPPPKVPRFLPTDTSYLSLNPEALSERFSRRVNAADLVRKPDETHEEKTVRAALFATSTAPYSLEPTDALDEVILAFLNG